MATIDETDVYADDVVLDATLPKRRLHFVGAVKADYAKWFCDPATFVELEHIPVPSRSL